MCSSKPALKKAICIPGVDKEKGEKPMHLNIIDGHRVQKEKAQGTQFCFVLLLSDFI